MEFLPDQLTQYIDIAWGWISSFVPFVVIAYILMQSKKKTGSLSSSQEVLTYSYWKDRDVSVIAKEFWSGLTNNNKILLIVLFLMNPLIGIAYGFYLLSRYSTQASKDFLAKEKNKELSENAPEDENTILAQEDHHIPAPVSTNHTDHNNDTSLETITQDASEDDNPPLFS